MNAAGWKSKLTPKQLENKRQGDREKQRRKRRESKASSKHIQDQLELLLSHNESIAVQTLVRENESLRAEVARLKDGLREIVALTTDSQPDAASQTATPEEDPKISTAKPLCQNVPFPLIHRPESLLARCSIPRQVAETASTDDNFSHMVSSIDGLVDGFLSWKLLQGHRTGLDFLMDAPEAEPCTGESFEFYSDLVRKVCGLASSGITGSTRAEPVSTDKGNGPKTDIETQDRRVAQYALHLVGPWLPKLRPVDRVVHFWISYALCKFWVFPTRRNLDQMPAWMIPVPAQFWNDHPGFLDFLPWPSLRTYLSHSWQQYDMNDVYLQLSESHGFAIEAEATEDWPLSFDTSTQSLTLDIDFKLAMMDLNNFRIYGRFAKAYPELLLLIQADCTVSSELLKQR